MSRVDDPQSGHFGDVIGESSAMRELFALLRRVSTSTLSVLIEGETGTGKEAVARSIHGASERAQRPFVVLDCSAIPRDLIESTLFGHERGAFTGAVGQQDGVFERANGGTLFLDEIGELDLAMQPKLLRALETGEIRRVGGQRSIPVDVRILAATNRDLCAMVDDAEFREDLYYRLAVVRAPLPPLRARRKDIDLLAAHFVDQLNRDRTERSLPQLTMDPDLKAVLRTRRWPGNVRQLRNVVERAMSLTDGTVIGLDDIEPELREPLSGSLEDTSSNTDKHDQIIRYTVDSSRPFKEVKAELLEAFERRYLEQLMEHHGDNVSRGARASGLTRFYLRELLKKRGMRGEEPRDGLKPE